MFIISNQIPSIFSLVYLYLKSDLIFSLSFLKFILCLHSYSLFSLTPESFGHNY